MGNTAGRRALHWLAPVVLLCALSAALLGRSAATPLDSTAALAKTAISCGAGEPAPPFPPPCERVEEVVDDAEAPLLLASTAAISHQRGTFLRSERSGPDYRPPPETPPPRG